jgi:hypothetical protein
MRIEHAIEQRFDGLAAGMWRTGTVTGTSGTQIIVAVENTSMTLPKLATYTPTVGDVVIIAARPGSWFVLGTIG